MSKSIALLVLLVASATHGLVFAAAGEQAQTVGRRQVSYEDSTRRNWSDTGNRPLRTLIWYPAAAGTSELNWEIAIFAVGHSAADAAMVASPTRLPLVVISHGTGGSAATLAWLAEALARRGYVVAAVNHHGNTAAEGDPRLEGTFVWADRVKDVSALIDRLLADPAFGPRIDASRIGVAGFSIGGYTALAAVGARISPDRLAAACVDARTAALCKLPPEMSDRFGEEDVARMLRTNPRVRDAMAHMGDGYSDPRIRAAFVLAPVFTSIMTTESLASIEVPVQVRVGSRDSQAVPSVVLPPLEAAVPHLSIKVLPQVGHYTFLPTCTARGRQFVKAICEDAAGVDRQAVHDNVNEDAADFFDSSMPPR